MFTDKFIFINRYLFLLPSEKNKHLSTSTAITITFLQNLKCLLIFYYFCIKKKLNSIQMSELYNLPARIIYFVGRKNYL